jgi:broad specificity phosphatase PhoE
MSIVHFITHPQVVIDPTIPVPQWPLSFEGKRRMRVMLRQSWVARICAVFSSPERKAVDGAEILADHLALPITVIEELRENDRASTGYLPQKEFEALADEFFARPQESIRGWERAADAQRRIISGIDQIRAQSPTDGDIALISHGGVGTLFLCHLMGVPISRAQDQQGSGGGNVYSFDATNRVLISGWRRLEETFGGMPR